MRTDTLAIVFTDIKGYTAATSSQTHQENARMLRRVERIVTPVVLGYNGRVVKSIGDAYMIVFRSPTEAVQCSTAVQDRLHQHNMSTSADQAIHIRIAMNFGEVRVHRGDVFGDPVNIAARIEGVTPADEVYLSEALYLTMNRSDVATEFVGEYELKGIPEPVTVYRVRKFAHLDDAEGNEDADTDSAGNVAAAGLPYGGLQLAHWRRLRWLRRAYQAMWTLAVLGIIGAGYLRYRPSSDYSHLVEEARTAAEKERPMEVLGAAGQIPISAAAERQEARRYRLEAVDMLIAKEKYDVARNELESLLAEAERDAEALLLRGLLHHRTGDVKASVADLQDSLELDPKLGVRADVVAAIVAGYEKYETRKISEFLVESVLKHRAVPALKTALDDSSFGDRTARRAIATRLEKLGAGHEVDWVQLWIEDLGSTSCKIRKAAIGKLSVEKDIRAVGFLLQVAESKACGAQYARNVANQINK